MEKKSCKEAVADLERQWDDLIDGQRTYALYQLARENCQEAVPLLLRLLREAQEPDDREQAIRSLGELGRRDLRQILMETHLMDPDENVRATALVHLSELFRGEHDREILQLALAAFDNPSSGVGMRLTAGAMMMYQLGMGQDEKGRPAWWDEREEELSHPLIHKAAEEARRLLAESTP